MVFFLYVKYPGHQISTKKVGLIGNHGNEKLQPFMVAFFRASLTNSQRHLGQHLLQPQSDASDEDDDEEISSKSSRIRRQTPNNNRKRSKDSEDFGSWNPYTGTCNLVFLMFI